MANEQNPIPRQTVIDLLNSMGLELNDLKHITFEVADEQNELKTKSLASRRYTRKIRIMSNDNQQSFFWGCDCFDGTFSPACC